MDQVFLSRRQDISLLSHPIAHCGPFKKIIITEIVKKIDSSFQNSFQ